MKLKRIMSILLTGLVLSACYEKQGGTVRKCHEWSDPIILEEPTCVTPGKKQRVCNICGEKEEIKEIKVDMWNGHLFVTKEEKLPTYSSKGYLAHQECQRCQRWYDLNNNYVDKESYILDEAGDDLAITVNGTQKGIFTKNVVPNNSGGSDVNWTVENIELKVDDLITITKPIGVTTRYAFSGDATLEKDRVKIAGTYNVTLTSSPDGFILAFSAQNVQ